MQSTVRFIKQGSVKTLFCNPFPGIGESSSLSSSFTPRAPLIGFGLFLKPAFFTARFAKRERYERKVLKFFTLRTLRLLCALCVKRTSFKPLFLPLVCNEGEPEGGRLHGFTCIKRASVFRCCPPVPGVSVGYLLSAPHPLPCGKSRNFGKRGAFC